MEAAKGVRRTGQPVLRAVQLFCAVSATREEEEEED